MSVATQTSSDTATEQAVMRALDELAGEGRTILIIAHRQSTLADCDLVIRLEDGRIAEVSGSPEALLNAG